MAARDHQQTNRLPRRPIECVELPVLAERMEEEISRATRHGGALACIYLRIDELAKIQTEHGAQISTQAVEYVRTALTHEFRRFDRLGCTAEGQFLVLLAGADAAKGELVARRTLKRLRAIKIEVGELRLPLSLSATVATWRSGQNARQLIEQVQATARREKLGFQDAVRL
jgi:GGDEF domain-containing protein